MALPDDVTTFVLTLGPYTDAAGEPVFAGMTGKIKPSFPQIRHVASGAVVIDSPIPVVIDGFGVASVELAHTDQAILSPVGFTYSVVWDVASRKPSPGNKQFAVPTSAGAVVDFDLLAPSPDFEGVVVPLTFGKSAYDLAVENGFVGTEDAWLASLVGPMGTSNPTGGAGGALSGSYPNPGLNATSIDTVVAGRVGDTASATSGALRSTLVPRTLLSSASPFVAATRLDPTNTIVACGVDTVDGRLFGRDVTNGQLKQSSDWATSWSINKTLPTDVTAANVVRILRFGANLYLLAKATATNLVGVYRASPAAGNTAFSWSGPLFTMSATAAALIPTFSASSTHLFLADYGDPTGGPQMVRSPDGTTWETVFGPDASLRHIHAVEPDPYNPGHVWVTAGDGTAKTVMKSTNNLAPGSLQVVVASSAWQAVQISFDEKYVWLAGDSQRTSVIVIDRATGIPRSAATNHHKNTPVPGGAAGDTYYNNAYYGAVDPATGIYYCVANDTSAPGTNMGMFYLPGAGQRLELLDAGGKSNNMNQHVFIAGGYVFSGQWRHALLTA